MPDWGSVVSIGTGSATAVTETAANARRLSPVQVFLVFMSAARNPSARLVPKPVWNNRGR